MSTEDYPEIRFAEGEPDDSYVGENVQFFDEEGTGPFAAMITAIGFNPMSPWAANLVVFDGSRGFKFETRVPRMSNPDRPYSPSINGCYRLRQKR